jgi:hypothetical protein
MSSTSAFAMTSGVERERILSFTLPWLRVRSVDFSPEALLPRTSQDHSNDLPCIGWLIRKFPNWHIFCGQKVAVYRGGFFFDVCLQMIFQQLIHFALLFASIRIL